MTIQNTGRFVQVQWKIRAQHFAKSSIKILNRNASISKIKFSWKEWTEFVVKLKEGSHFDFYGMPNTWHKNYLLNKWLWGDFQAYKGFQRLMLTIFLNSYFNWNTYKSIFIRVVWDAYEHQRNIEKMKELLRKKL